MYIYYIIFFNFFHGYFVIFQCIYSHTFIYFSMSNLPNPKYDYYYVMWSVGWFSFFFFFWRVMIRSSIFQFETYSFKTVIIVLRQDHCDVDRFQRRKTYDKYFYKTMINVRTHIARRYKTEDYYYHYCYHHLPTKRRGG